MDFTFVKIKSENRQRILNSGKRFDARMNRKTKRHYKRATYIEAARLTRKFGYDVDLEKPQPEALRQCCEEFKNKLRLYNGEK